MLCLEMYNAAVEREREGEKERCKIKRKGSESPKGQSRNPMHSQLGKKLKQCPIRKRNHWVMRYND